MYQKLFKMLYVTMLYVITQSEVLAEKNIMNICTMQNVLFVEFGHLVLCAL